MIKVGIIGVSGYSGMLALELLLKHDDVRLTYVGAQNTQGRLDQICPRLKGKTDLHCDKFDLKKALQAVDLFFLAVPHTASMPITPKLLQAEKKVIDLSADYRLKSKQVYERWYEVKHTDTKNFSRAVYGLPEFYREDIKKASLVANPGCYPTAALLALAPLVSTRTDSIQSIIIDAKSGVSGAGRKVVSNLMFAEVNENFKAYKVLSHQHTPEINLYLSKMAGRSIKTTFVAHLLPINRGILETIYVRMNEKVSESVLYDLYRKFYKTEKFVRVLPLGSQPEIKDVTATNYCDLGLVVSKDKNLIVITSVIDNLMKGAAGQAVQNMNLMCGFAEDKGLV
ncbi:MAG TPA: N-acetyl-gamma-glutamyl-phosphate reductase [Candidatus Omnitrophota bacterium]|nr:N-acetyl-gamma-glutamyl-phosphate reductase [Candidatus Omnitrophota bacterium]